MSKPSMLVITLAAGGLFASTADAQPATTRGANPVQRATALCTRGDAAQHGDDHAAARALLEEAAGARPPEMTDRLLARILHARATLDRAELPAPALPDLPAWGLVGGDRYRTLARQTFDDVVRPLLAAITGPRISEPSRVLAA